MLFTPTPELVLGAYRLGGPVDALTYLALLVAWELLPLADAAPRPPAPAAVRALGLDALLATWFRAADGFGWFAGLAPNEEAAT